MKTYSLTGSDVLKINNRILADLADADAGAITFPNNIAEMKVGKNKNVIYAENATGDRADMVLRVLRGSSDDKYINNLLNAQRNNFAGTVLLTAEFIKNIGDGNGNISQDIIPLKGGIFTKLVEAKTNAEGDTEQSVSVYSVSFMSDNRSIG
jgi:hypothetical protein